MKGQKHKKRSANEHFKEFLVLVTLFLTFPSPILRNPKHGWDYKSGMEKANVENPKRILSSFFLYMLKHNYLTALFEFISKRHEHMAIKFTFAFQNCFYSDYLINDDTVHILNMLFFVM